MTPIADPITELLNIVQALVRSGAAKSYTEVATESGLTPQNVSDWVGQRRLRPSGLGALKLQTWAVSMTQKISKVGETDKEGRRLHQRYRAEYKKVSAEFPVNGRKS